MRLLPLFLLACTPATDDVPPSQTVPTAATCHVVTPLTPPACGTATERASVLVADHPAAAKADRYDRVYAATAAVAMDLNTEVVIALDDTRTREALDDLAAGDTWSLAEHGVDPLDGSLYWAKVAGAYGGVGLAADAMRYGVLRDEGAACAEVERAREILRKSLGGLHRAQAITGTPGVIARGYARNDLPGSGTAYATVPLFDEAGNPLPEEKNNGTWREDQSGQYPGYIWEDSCSRDMYMGWMTGMGLAYEVIAGDPAFEDEVAQLRTDALALATSFKTVQDSGYDLEIMDADGRRTFHGLLHEESIDRAYTPGLFNGQNAFMALGAVAVLAMVSDDAEVARWLEEDLLGTRQLHLLARDNAGSVDFGLQSNFSNYNMDYLGALLAGRYLCDADAREAIATGTLGTLYDREDRSRQPAEQSQTLYHLVALLEAGGSWAQSAGTGDATIAARIDSDLADFPDAPHWDVFTDLCDDGDDDDSTCTAPDGTVFTNLGEAGRNDTPIAEEPVPLNLRPPSNYYWRSNPYRTAGGGDGSVLLPGPDFRFVWWLGRWAQ